MARLNLRDYLREIEDLIESGRTDEAIAHSRYILELYPKHIETYRLLGKAYLETQRYSDAADVLQRVLSSIPDDFISNLGMSIIREDEGNLDAAIFFMERAFEVQPSNAAIQEELRRLYGRRDGLEPSKIHLTRGALARMYAKGELYEQAIAEIRATLAQEPQRTDLQVLLAQLYVKNGQNVDAVRTCQNIIQKFPYCQDANQILADKLPGTERADETQNYQKRLQALDPYAAHISASAPSTQHVPDNVITLEPYIWTPGDTGSDSEIRPDWATSLGVDIGSSASDEEAMPEWLVETNGTEKTPAFEPGSVDIERLTSMGDTNGQPVSDPQDETEITNHTSPQIEDDSADSEDQIPEWMQSVGWELSDKPLSDKPDDETQSQFTMDENSALDDAELEPAEIPEWLQSISPTPSETEHKTPALEDDSASDEPVTWLDEKTPGATDSIVTWLQAKDQLEALDDPEIEPARATESISIEHDEEAEDNLQPLDEQEDAELNFSLLQESDQESIDVKPDWLQDIAEEIHPAIRSEISVDPKNGFESPDDIEHQGAEYLADENIPEWLRDLSDESSPNGTIESLDETGSDIPVMSEMHTEETQERLQDLSESDTIEETLEVLPGDKEIETLSGLGLPETDAQPEVDLPEWLQSLGDETATGTELELPDVHEVATSEDAIEPKAQEQPLEGVPEWLITIGEEPIGDIALDTSADQIGEHLEEIGDPESASQPEKDVPEWLEDLSTKLPIDEFQRPSDEIEELTVNAVISEESVPPKNGETPEWAQALGSETSAEVSADSETVPVEGMPELLAALREEIKTNEAFEPRLSKTGETHMEHEEKIPELGPEDEDAALAWLESLAAKQGVDEEELISTPDDRRESPPDWVQQISAQSEAIEEDQVETREAIVTGGIDDKALQIPDLELEPDSRLSSESISEPLEETEGVPDWLQVLMEETTTEEKTPTLDEQATDFKQADEGTEAIEDIVPEWIRELAEESVDISAEQTFEEAAMIEGDTEPIAITQDKPEPLEVLSAELDVVQDAETSEQESDLESIETTLEEQIEAVSLRTSDEAETIPFTESEIPDWLKEADISESAQPTIEKTIEQEPETSEWVAGEDVEDSKQPIEPSQLDEDEPEIPEWIISEVVVEEVSETPSSIQPLEAKSIEDELEIPDWSTDEFSAETSLAEPLQEVETEMVEEQPQIPAEHAISAVDEPSEIPTPEQPLKEEEPEIPEWITSDEVAEKPEETAQPTEMLEAEEVEEEPEIPEWITAEDAVEPVSEAYDEPEPILTVVTEVPKKQIEEALIEELVEEELPSLVNINTASFKALERLPGIGPVIAQTIIDHRATHGTFKDVNSIQDVPGIGPKTLEIIRELLYIEYIEEPIPLPVSPEEKILTEGRRALEAGNISEAYEQYSELIEEEQFLDRVIDDLKDAQYRYPVEVNIYELLGDAYMRTDQIQEAINAFTKAEELLS